MVSSQFYLYGAMCTLVGLCTSCMISYIKTRKIDHLDYIILIFGTLLWPLVCIIIVWLLVKMSK